MWQIIWTVESETCLLQYPLFDCMYQRRIQITISLSGRTNTELQAQNIFPLYVMLARPTSNVSLEGVSLALSVCENEWWAFMSVFKMISILIYDPILQHSPIYRFSRVCLLTSFSEFGNKDNSEATFIIPDVKNLSTSPSCNLDIILISCGTVLNLYY